LEEPTGGLKKDRRRDPDLFHTHFGVAALALLRTENLPPVDPRVCLPLEFLPPFLATTAHEYFPPYTARPYSAAEDMP
jgi:prenyltransferase beta subunit